MKITDQPPDNSKRHGFTRRTALRAALALGIIPVTPDLSAGTSVTVTPVAQAGCREQVTGAVARDFLSLGYTAADLAPYRALSPFAKVADAMTGLTAGGAR